MADNSRADSGEPHPPLLHPESGLIAFIREELGEIVVYAKICDTRELNETGDSTRPLKNELHSRIQIVRTALMVLFSRWLLEAAERARDEHDFMNDMVEARSAYITAFLLNAWAQHLIWRYESCMSLALWYAEWRDGRIRGHVDLKGRVLGCGVTGTARTE